MDSSFWLRRWERGEIAFHETEVNPTLVKHFGELSLAKGSRVFVPLCGKSRDIAWLLSEGCRVAGAELVELAVEQLFDELGVEPEVSRVGEASRCRAIGLDLFVGDILGLSADALGPVDAVYDRAALVALPEVLRARYAAHVTEITGRASQLLVTYQYDQNVMQGPPFSVGDEEVRRHYGERYDVSRIEITDVDGGLKGRCSAREVVWLLRSRP